MWWNNGHAGSFGHLLVSTLAITVVTFAGLLVGAVLGLSGEALQIITHAGEGTLSLSLAHQLAEQFLKPREPNKRRKSGAENPQPPCATDLPQPEAPEPLKDSKELEDSKETD